VGQGDGGNLLLLLDNSPTEETGLVGQEDGGSGTGGWGNGTGGWEQLVALLEVG